MRTARRGLYSELAIAPAASVHDDSLALFNATDAARQALARARATRPPAIAAR